MEVPVAPQDNLGALNAPAGASASSLAELAAALPQSARQVFETLQTQGPLTHKDLVRVTGMPGRTVRYAVGRLKEAGIIGARCNLQDCRQCYFFVVGLCPGKEAMGPTNVVFAGIRSAY